jgi:hypothetical protein
MKQPEIIKKKIALTNEAREFLFTLEQGVKEQFTMICRMLEKHGFLIAPYGEKVEGHDNLFALRIVSGNNVRFFYFYVDKSDKIWILDGYEKRTRKIPASQIKNALQIKKRLEAEDE